MAMSLGKSMLYYGEVHGIEYTERRIMEVTPEMLRDVAGMLLSSPMSRITII